ncbi:Gfo/Idh/MocA family protein [Roseibium algae]
MVAKSHLLSIKDLADEITLTGVLTSSEKSGRAFARQAADICGYQVEAYESLDALCADGKVDWVIVLTPPNARLEIVQSLAAAGKSILMEKPVERDLAAATRIVEICEAAGVRLGIVFQHRVREASRALAALIKGGALGQLAIAEVIVPWWREQAYYDEPGRGTYERDGGGVLISQAIHSIDLMLSLTGRVFEVQAMAHTTMLHGMESEDYVTAGLKFESGAVGSLIASTASFPGEAESITLHFTKCVTHLQSGELKVKWRDGREELFGASATTGGGADPMAFTHDWHKDVIADFNRNSDEGGTPLVSGREALDVHALIDALITSSNSTCAAKVPYPEA